MSIRTSERDALRILRDADPMRTTSSLLTPAARAAQLTAITHSSRQPADAGRARSGARRHRRAFATAGAGAATAVAVAVFLVIDLVGPGSTPAFAAAATPALIRVVPPHGTAAHKSARLVLQALATPLGKGAGGPIALAPATIVLQEWDLDTTIAGARVRSAVVPQRRRMTVSADGSGAITTQNLAPEFPDATHERVWRTTGEPGSNTEPTTDHFAAGKMPEMWSTPAPTGAAQMSAFLAIGHPEADGPAETLVAVADLTHEQVLSDKQRGAVLEALSLVPGLRYDGTATDRIGRQGDLFSVASNLGGLPSRYSLIISPTTGLVLDFEQELTQTAGKLGVAIPAVISYSTLVSATAD